MKILFLHNNFPGQFVHIANALSAADDNEVVYISQFKREGIASEKIRHILAPIRKPASNKSKVENILLNTLHAGEDYANCMMKLKGKGFYPDVIYDHSGWGCGMYAADIFPDAKRICYCEWFYGKNADFTYFKPLEKRHPIEFATGRQRNTIILNNLNSCHCGITPTRWQYSQLPPEYRHKIQLLHDGIDTAFFSPAKTAFSEMEGIDLSGTTEIVTYATRGLEPYRGFPEFYSSLPGVLKARPTCHVIIMANDKCYYGEKRRDGKTWGEYMRKTVPLDINRVHFVDFGSYEKYRMLLRLSTIHVYLTVPFVLSWSLLEAMSCGGLLVASDTEPVQEVINDDTNGILCNIRDINSITQQIIYGLSMSKEKSDTIRENARQTIIESYSVRDAIQRQMEIFDSILQS